MQNTCPRDIELNISVENDVMTVSRRYKLIGSGSRNGERNGDENGNGNGDGNGNDNVGCKR